MRIFRELNTLIGAACSLAALLLLATLLLFQIDSTFLRPTKPSLRALNFTRRPLPFILRGQIILPLHCQHSQLIEPLLDIDIALGTGLKEYHVSILFTELLRIFVAHSPLVLQIHFIPEHQERQCLRRFWLAPLHEMGFPIGQVLETTGVGDIIDHTAAVSTPVEGGGQTLEPLLPGRVPYLEDAHFPIV